LIELCFSFLPSSQHFFLIIKATSCPSEKKHRQHHGAL
ncbi:hypothetical protein CSUI_001872, partial [Cystoisospora suis]